jgi:hydrogenase maturation protease
MTRVLGVGSPFGADRLAWLAIDHFAEQGLQDCELLKLDRPGSQLVSYFQGADLVVIIDAVRLSETPGGVVSINLERLHQLEYHTSSHGFGVAESIALAGQLGELPARLCLLGIQTGKDVDRLPSIDLGMLTTQVNQLLESASG